MPWLHPGDNQAQIEYLHSFRSQNFFIAGRGAGKTAVACKKAEVAARLFPGIIIMITEQTTRDINDILIPAWRDVVSEGIYTMHGSGGQCEVRFKNGSKVWFRSRQAKRVNDDPPFRGPTVGMLIHDELALDRREDVLEISGMMLRQKRAPLCIDVITTPKPNWLYRHVLSLGLANPVLTDADRVQITPDNKAAAFYGKTRDNVHNRGLDARMRDRLSERDAKQELDAGWVLNEGRVWNFEEELWPNGNLINSAYSDSKPWIIGVDLGGADSAWGLYQLEHHKNPDTGRREQLLVAKAEWTPHSTPPWDIILEIKEYTKNNRVSKRPSAVKVGADYRTPGTTGHTAEHMLDQAGWSSAVEVIKGWHGAKDVQHRQAAYLIKASNGARQFCVSTKLDSFYNGKTRGLLDMLRHDTFPDPGTPEYFRKEKAKGIYHEDSRDQFLYTCIGVYPPDFRPQMTWPG